MILDAWLHAELNFRGAPEFVMPGLYLTTFADRVGPNLAIERTFVMPIRIAVPVIISITK